MPNLIKEYRDAIKISRLNRLRFKKFKTERMPKIAIIDGPLDESRIALCKEYQDVLLDDSSICQGKVINGATPALAHSCAIFDRIRKWVKKSDIYAISIFKQELKTSSKTLFNAIVAAIKLDVDIINVSVGINDLSEEVQANMRDVCDYAEKQGIIIVAASKRKQQLVPAIFNNVITVQGEDLGSPGTFFVKTKPSFCVIAHGGAQTVRAGGKIHVIEGSSFATAEVSGIIARLITKYGRMSLMECRKYLPECANGEW